MSAHTEESKSLSSAEIKNAGNTRIAAVVFTVIVLSLSGLYLRFEWNRYKGIASSEAVMLAESLESILHSEHVAELEGSEEDLEKPEYIMAKTGLARLAGTTNPIRFAYIMAEREGRIVFLIDSESPDSPDYSPPGQVYEEAGEALRSVFRTGRTVLSDPQADRWGTWISALVPIKDPAGGKVIAVLGIDYSASDWYARLWKRMIPDGIIVISLLLLFFALLHTLRQHSALKYLTEKLALDEALYHSVFDQAPTGIAIVNDKSFVSRSEYGEMNINPMFERILGRESHELSKLKWMEITHPEDLQPDLDKFGQFKAGIIKGYTMEKRFLRPDGSSVWTNMKVSPLLGAAGKNSMHLCLLEDISARKAAEESLKESERSKSVLLSHLPGMAYRCSYNREWTMQFVSDGCLELTGYAPESLVNNRDRSFNDLIAPEYRDLLWDEWQRLLPERLPFRYEYEITTADGKRKWVLELAEGIFNEKGEAEALEGIVIDISDRKEIEDTLRYNNEHDRWTGLFNRNYLEKLLAGDLRERSGENRALVLINLSTLQSLTTAYGFHYTQDLIKKAAEKLNEYCTDRRLLFYTYTNRFVFYLKEYRDKDELLEFCETLASALGALLSSERIGGGIGIVEIGRAEEPDEDMLLRKLLIASEKAVSAPDRDFSVCFYDGEMEREIIREQEIKRELARGAAGDENSGLFLQYQPILDLRSNRICGFEALARLNSEKLGLVSPLEFIPIAEKTKLIVPIGREIFRRAFRFLKKLEEGGLDSVSVSVNVSALQVLAERFTADLLGMIGKMRVRPENIGIEITESVFSMDYQGINRILGELRDSGLHIAIDDFGTGYSSLARERELNVDCLKIDKYFIDKLLTIDPGNAITADIISMAHKLGHYVIAEGVEHEEQKEYLRNNGCEKIQGYLIARPLDEEAVNGLIRRQAESGPESA